MSAPFAFAPLTATTAPTAATAFITGSEQKFGFVPSPVARLAHAPVALRQLLGALTAFDQTSLTPIEREVVAMTVAWENECHYCMALHTALMAGAPEHAETVAALRAGTPLQDARLEALRVFVLEVMRERGRPSLETWHALARAGFTEPQALEIVLGVGAYFMSTLFNIITRAELDPPFVPFEWSRPVQGRSSSRGRVGSLAHEDFAVSSS
jgi:AhpD family alkylhydroperoxidase